MFKRSLAILTLAGAVTSSSFASLNVIWQGLDGFYRSDEVTPLLNPIGSGTTALCQLIYTPVNAWGLPHVGGGVDALEEVLAEFVNVEAGDGSNLYGELPAQSYVGAFASGYLYIRIFDQGTGAGGAGVGNSTAYYNSPLYATVDQADPVMYQTVYAQGSNTIDGFGDALTAMQPRYSLTEGAFGDVLSVPEPSTVALVGTTGVLLIFRRGKRRV